MQNSPEISKQINDKTKGKGKTKTSCPNFPLVLPSAFLSKNAFSTFRLLIINNSANPKTRPREYSLIITAMARLGRMDTSKNLENLLDMDKSMAARNAALPPAAPRKMIPGQGLEFKNLSYSIMKKHKKDGAWITREAYLLDDISGQAVRGEVMAIMGPSGAGKSTFLDALAGRIAQGSLEGSVRIDGKPVSSSEISCVCNKRFI